jgi:hypothetical protein
MNVIGTGNQVSSLWDFGESELSPVRKLKHTVNKVLSLRDKNDVRPFIKNPSEMNIWSTDYFLQLVDRINFIH